MSTRTKSQSRTQGYADLRDLTALTDKIIHYRELEHGDACQDPER